MNFIEEYQKVALDKKLNFLSQLLEKDTSLQQQFIAFIQEENLDKTAGINIDEVRDKIWEEIYNLDIDDIMEDYLYDGGYYDYDYSDTAYDILDNIFEPYFKSSLDYLNRANYLDAFRVILAIYELQTVEAPDIENDTYYVFADDIESYIETTTSKYLDKFNKHIDGKILSDEMTQKLIDLLLERYIDNEKYNFAYFNDFIKIIIDTKSKAKYLIDVILEHNLYDEESAIILIHIAKTLENNKLFLQVANQFYRFDSEIAIELLKKYKELNRDDDFALIAENLLNRGDSYKYTLLIIENIDKDRYIDLYIKALKRLISYEYSMKYYKILREYLDESERLKFIKSFENSHQDIFYIQLLEIEEQYSMILDFAQRYNNIYGLVNILKPIVSIYPDEVLQIIIKKCDKLIESRGRGNYKMASELLSLLFNNSYKQQQGLRDYIDKIYHHKPNLPALRDELRKAGLV